MNRLTAVEGINGAGKTTFVDEFIRLNSNYVKLYEISEKHEEGRKFPKFSSNYSDVLDQDLWFFKEESQKNTEALRILNHNNVLSDRWIISLFAFAYARNKIYATNDTTYLKNLLENSRMVLPWIIYVDAPSDITASITSRNENIYQKNERSLESPYTSEFYFAQVEYYEKLLETLGSDAIRINNKDCHLQNISKVRKWIEQKNEPYSARKLTELIL